MFTFQEISLKKLSILLPRQPPTIQLTWVLTFICPGTTFFLLHTHVWLTHFWRRLVNKWLCTCIMTDWFLYYLCPVFGPPIHSQPAKQNKDKTFCFYPNLSFWMFNSIYTFYCFPAGVPCNPMNFTSVTDCQTYCHRCNRGFWK